MKFHQEDLSPNFPSVRLSKLLGLQQFNITDDKSFLSESTRTNRLKIKNQFTDLQKGDATMQTVPL
jgi:hypothetical protein